MRNTDGSIDKLGCSTCLSRLYTRAEVERDRCNDCIDRAVQEWRDFEDKHAYTFSQH